MISFLALNSGMQSADSGGSTSLSVNSLTSEDGGFSSILNNNLLSSVLSENLTEEGLFLNISGEEAATTIPLDGEVLPLDELLTGETAKLLNLSEEDLADIEDIDPEDLLLQLEEVLSPQQFSEFKKSWNQIVGSGNSELIKVVSLLAKKFIAQSDTLSVEKTEKLSLDGSGVFKDGEVDKSNITAALGDLDKGDSAKKLKDGFIKAMAKLGTFSLEQDNGKSYQSVSTIFSEVKPEIQLAESTDNLVSKSSMNLNLSVDKPLESIIQPQKQQSNVAVTDIAEFKLEKPISTHEWQQSISEKVVWMAKNGNSTAKIQVTPAELGPIEAKVTLNDEGASVTFSAHHATTREAIEAAIPRLRDMFVGAGLNFAGADVNSGKADTGAGDTDSGRGGNNMLSEIDEAEDVGEQESVVNVSIPVGLVDSYV